MTDLGYHLASIAARRLPVWVTDRMAVWLADVYASTHPNRARHAGLRVAHVWREAGLVGPPPHARETFRAFAWALRDFLAARGSGVRAPEVRLDPEARRHLSAAQESGIPTVVVSGHFGPWEMALWWLAREVGPLDAVTAPHRLPAVERFFRAHRAAFGVRTIGSHHPAAAAIQSLRSGSWIAALADRAWSPKGTRARCRRSGLVAVDSAPLIIAQRANAQLLPGVVWRDTDGMIAVRFHAPFTLTPSRGGQSVAQATEAVSRFFDAHVRAHPTQWFDWSAWALRDSAR